MLVVLLFSCFALFQNVITQASHEWNIKLKYSIGEKDFGTFGNVIITKQMDGNFTGDFIPNKSMVDLLNVLTNAAENSKDTDYKMRVDNTFSLNSLRVFSYSNFGHSIELTIDQHSRKVLSVTHYPTTSKSSNGRMQVDVRVRQIKEISGPETTSYLHRIEEEKRARQHGASQDNRPFLQKYWMYFVPVILFMTNGDTYCTIAKNHRGVVY